MIHDACHNRWQLAKSTLALSSVIPDTSDWQQRERRCRSWGRGRQDDEHSRQTGTRVSEQLSLARPPLSCRCIGQAQHTHTRQCVTSHADVQWRRYHTNYQPHSRQLITNLRVIGKGILECITRALSKLHTFKNTYIQSWKPFCETAKVFQKYDLTISLQMKSSTCIVFQPLEMSFFHNKSMNNSCAIRSTLQTRE